MHVTVQHVPDGAFAMDFVIHIVAFMRTAPIIDLTFIQIITSGLVIDQELTFGARALVGARQIDAGVRAVAIVDLALVDVHTLGVANAAIAVTT